MQCGCSFKLSGIFHFSDSILVLRDEDLNASLNIEEVFGHHFWAFVDRLPGSVENPSEHVLGDWSAKDVAGEFACRFLRVDPRCSLENLHDRLGSRDLENLARPVRAVRKLQVHDLRKLGKLDVVEDNKRAVDPRDSPKKKLLKVWTYAVLDDLDVKKLSPL